MSEPVAPSQAVDKATGVHPQADATVEAQSVEFGTSLPSIESATTSVAEIDHVVDTVLLKRIFEAALLTSPEPLAIAELKRLSDIPLEALPRPPGVAGSSG